MEPFIQAADKSRPLVKPADIAIIFNLVPELIKLSTKVAQQLEQAIDPWQSGKTQMNDIFVSLLTEFGVYSQYAENYREIRSAVDRIDQSDSCQKFLQVRLSNEHLTS